MNLDLGALVLCLRLLIELALQLGDMFGVVALCAVIVGDGLVDVGEALADQREHLAPVRVGRGGGASGGWAQRQPGEVIDELRLDFRGGDGRVISGLLVQQRLQIVLQFLARVIATALVLLRRKKLPGIDRADLDLAGGLALDAHTVAKQAGGQILQHHGLVARAQLDVGDAGDFGAIGKDGDGIDARACGEVVGRSGGGQ